MEMRKYLRDTFLFNSQANMRLLEKIKLMPDPAEATRLMCHLVNCQFKWMARIRQDPRSPEMSWWEPMYAIDEIEGKWFESLNVWLEYLDQTPDAVLEQPVAYPGYDTNRWKASPQDIALQLNYHSIHHRAQIQMMIRAQGMEPDFVDYIGTKAVRV